MGTDPIYNNTLWQHLHIKNNANNDSGYIVNIERVPSYVFSKGNKIGTPSSNVDKLTQALSSIIAPVRKSIKKGGRKTRRRYGSK